MQQKLGGRMRNQDWRKKDLFGNRRRQRKEFAIQNRRGGA